MPAANAFDELSGAGLRRWQAVAKYSPTGKEGAGASWTVQHYALDSIAQWASL